MTPVVRKIDCQYMHISVHIQRLGPIIPPNDLYFVIGKADLNQISI
jgi:hypothetical protein